MRVPARPLLPNPETVAAFGEGPGSRWVSGANRSPFSLAVICSTGGLRPDRPGSEISDSCPGLIVARPLRHGFLPDSAGADKARSGLGQRQDYVIVPDGRGHSAMEPGIRRAAGAGEPERNESAS